MDMMQVGQVQSKEQTTKKRGTKIKIEETGEWEGGASMCCRRNERGAVGH